MPSETRHGQFVADPLRLVDKKLCTRCKIIKPVAEFYKHTQHGKPGWRANCKVCCLEVHGENKQKFVLLQKTGAKKVCRTCKQEKSLSEFYCKQPDCKKCSGVQMKIYRENHTEESRAYRKNRYQDEKEERRVLKRQQIYGISQIEYNEMFILQDGCCAICGRHQSNFKYALGVDHNHKTNEVRGLLCGACNRGIGLLSDDVEKLKKAVLYLEKNYADRK